MNEAGDGKRAELARLEERIARTLDASRAEAAPRGSGS